MGTHKKNRFNFGKINYTLKIIAMSKGTYCETVTYEEIKFDAKLKKEVKEKKLVSGSGVRITRGDGTKANPDVYYEVRTVGNHGTRVEEGQVIVTFDDGRQKVLSSKEFEEQITPIKEKKGDKAADDGPVAVIPLSDGTVQRLTQDQTKKMIIPAADAAAAGTAGSDEGTTNPVTKKGE